MGRRGVYRGVYSVLLNDPDFRRLSPAARHTLLTMRLADYCGRVGFFRYEPSTIAVQTGYPQAQLEPLFVELEGARFVLREGEWIWLRNALRFDPHTNLDSKFTRTHVERAITGLPRGNLLRKFCRHYRLPYPLEAPSRPPRRKSKAPPKPPQGAIEGPGNRDSETPETPRLPIFPKPLGAPSAVDNQGPPPADPGAGPSAHDFVDVDSPEFRKLPVGEQHRILRRREGKA